LFPSFATSVIDNGGKLPPVLLTPVENLPWVSVAVLVAKFIAGAVDTSGAP
jgi:hypothetical protein